MLPTYLIIGFSDFKINDFMMVFGDGFMLYKVFLFEPQIVPIAGFTAPYCIPFCYMHAGWYRTAGRYGFLGEI